MPRLIDDNMDVIKIAGAGNFQFSGVRLDDLEATKYCLVTIAIDKSTSVEYFNDELLKAKKSIIDACKKSPLADNLMIRLIEFNHNLEEVHGFKLLSTIDPNDYEAPLCDGMTALYDATYTAIGATITYAKNLTDQDYDANGICFIITDGMNNRGKTTPKMINDLVKNAKLGEEIESLITILVGVNTQNSDIKQYLDEFSREANLTQFVDVGDATPQKLAKLATFVSKSISSQSQALGTGGPSQSLNF